MNLPFQVSGRSSEKRISVPMTPVTRQCAARISPLVVETHPVQREAINVRRLIRCPTVGADGFITLIDALMIPAMQTRSAER
jgi:hypothetical protein